MAEIVQYISDECVGRPLHFIWMVDCSGSMSGEMMNTVNHAIRSAIPGMVSAGAKLANTQMLVHVLQFSDGASWMYGDPVPAEKFEWKDLQAGGVTDMGAAFGLLAERLASPLLLESGLPPVLVLISDGYPTDDYEAALNQLLQQPWGKKAARIAISIGSDADETVLAEFTGNREFVLRANDAKMLEQSIKWAAAAVSTVMAPVGIPLPEEIGIGDISHYVSICERFLQNEMPNAIRENYQNLMDRVGVLQESIEKYKDIYRADIDQLNEYFMPEALRVTAAFLHYRADGASEEILSEAEISVYQATKKLLQVVNEKIDEIYRFVLIETTAKAKAVEAMMCQDGHVDAEYKI